MTIMTNTRGTTEGHFRLGLTGPTIYTGTDDPNNTAPTPIDTFRVGDLYLRQGGDGAAWMFDGTAWDECLLTGGTPNFNSVVIGDMLSVGGSAIFANGDEDLPSITFFGDAFTGFYLGTATNTIGVAVGGEEGAFLGPTGIDLISQTSADVRLGLKRISNGVGEKNWSIDATSSGLQIVTRDDAGVLGGPAYAIGRTGTVVSGHTWVTGGTPRLSLTGTAMTPTVPVVITTGSAAAPALSFTGDTTTGLYRNSASQMGFATGGVQSAILTGSSFTKIRAGNIPNISTRRDDTGVADQIIGAFLFNGQDNGGNPHTYAGIGGVIADPTNGAEFGGMTFEVSIGGSLLSTAFLTEAGFSKKRSGAAPRIAVERENIGVADNTLGSFAFDGQNAAAADFTYAEIVGTITDPTGGAEEARVDINIASDTVVSVETGSVAVTGDLRVSGTGMGERLQSGSALTAGTVVVIDVSGADEIIACAADADPAVVGVVAVPGLGTDSEAGTDTTHPFVVLKGKVTVNVTGAVAKGALLVSSATAGHAKEATGGEASTAGAVFAKSLEEKVDTDPGTVLALIL